MTRDDAQAMIAGVIDELRARTAIPASTIIHAEVLDDPSLDMYTQAWRRPGWDVDFAESRPGEVWDHDPGARITITTGLIAALGPRRLRALLAHEVAHVEAGDHLSEVWVDADREQRADHRAVEICGDGPALAAGLLVIFRDKGRETASHAESHGSVDDRVGLIGGFMAGGLGE